MLRNRLRSSSRFFKKKNNEVQRGLSHTTGLLSSLAVQGLPERLKRSTLVRESRFSLETSSDNYKTGSVQFRVHRALGVISEQSVLLPTAFAARIRMMSPLDAPRSPVVAVRADFLAKVDEDVWSAHQRGSRALVSWPRCTERGFFGLFIAPPIPRPSSHHNTTLYQFPAYRHSLTHHFIIQLIVPARPYHIPSLPVRPSSSPARPPSVATAFLGLQPSPPASPPPSPLLFPRTMPKSLFLADLCVLSCERFFNNSCAPPLRSVLSCTRSLRCPQAPSCGGRAHPDGYSGLPYGQIL